MTQGARKYRNATLALGSTALALWIVAGAIVITDTIDGEASLHSATGLFVGQLALGATFIVGVLAYIWYRAARAADFAAQIERMRERCEAESLDSGEHRML